MAEDCQYTWIRFVVVCFGLNIFDLLRFGCAQIPERSQSLTAPIACSMFVLMEVETLGVARSPGWKVHMRCANGYRRETRSMRRCVYRKQLDLVVQILRLVPANSARSDSPKSTRSGSCDGAKFKQTVRKLKT